MTHASSWSEFRSITRCSFALAALGMMVGATASAQDDDPGGTPSYVVYNPDTVMALQGQAPFQYAYSLTIKSPTAIQAGASVTVAVNVEVIGAAPGSTAAAAARFVSVSPSTVSYTGPNQTAIVTVSLDIPSGTEQGEFRYHLSTTGWPAGAGIQDAGTSINMVVTPPFSFPAVSVQIDAPAAGAEFNHVAGRPALLVPISVMGVCSSGNPVDSVAVTLSAVDAGGATIPLPTVNWIYSGAGTAQEVVTGQLPVTSPGTYTLHALARDHLGGTATATSTFTVNQSFPPPTVVITQPPGVLYDYYLGGAALQIPFAFEGSSSLGGIRSLSATLNGAPVALVPAGLGSLVATASGVLNVAAGGDYLLEVTATDDQGVATDSVSFHVNALTVPSTLPVHGTVFFDVNSDGHRQPCDYGLPGLSVHLTAANGQSMSTTTGVDGVYSFNVSPGVYVVAVQPVKGFRFTTASRATITVVGAPVGVPACGLGLFFPAIRTLSADGCTIGFWKNNLDKALAGKHCGTQVSAATLNAYTSVIATLALDPFDGLTMKQAAAIMGASTSVAKNLLAKQLVASEYNYAAGAYIGGNATLTYAFITFAEYVLQNAASFPTSYVLYVKDWCDAYNNSHGGRILGPTDSSAGSQNCDRDHDRDDRCDRERDSRDHSGGCDRNSDRDRGHH